MSYDSERKRERERERERDFFEIICNISVILLFPSTFYFIIDSHFSTDCRSVVESKYLF